MTAFRAIAACLLWLLPTGCVRGGFVSPPDEAALDAARADGAPADGDLNDGSVTDRAWVDATLADATLADGALADGAVADIGIVDAIASDAAAADHGIEDRARPDAIAMDSRSPDVAPYAGFAFTTSSVAATEDMTATCQAQLGAGWQVADWNDLVAYQSSSGDLTPLLDAIGMPTPNPQLWVTWNGVRTYGTSASCPAGRYYFIERHDHVLPGYFMAHANIDNYLLSLGSWCDFSTRALCFLP